jgi:hypothetical protein
MKQKLKQFQQLTIPAKEPGGGYNQSVTCYHRLSVSHNHFYSLVIEVIAIPTKESFQRFSSLPTNDIMPAFLVSNVT